MDSDPDQSLPVVLAVGGGKGGVGKSLFSSNLGTQIAQSGYRCLIIDLDLGSANLHTYFGIPHPKTTLDDFLQSEHVTFRDLILKGPVPGLGIIAGGRSDERSQSNQLSYAVLQRLWRGIMSCRSQEKIDFVILDLGAGTHNFTVELFSAAHLGVVAILPEPTSIENAYVFLRAHLWKLVENLGERLRRPHEALAIQQALGELNADHLDQGYFSVLKSLYPKYPEFVKALGTVVVSRKIGLLVNQVRSREDREIGFSMENICRRFFGLQSHNLGYLNYDEAAWKSLRNRRLLLFDFPHSLIVQRMKRVAHGVLNLAK